MIISIFLLFFTSKIILLINQIKFHKIRDFKFRATIIGYFNYSITTMIICAGIAANIPRGIGKLLELTSQGVLSLFVTLFVMLGALILVYIVVFIESAQRKIPIHYDKKQVGNKINIVLAQRRGLYCNFICTIIYSIFYYAMFVY